MSITVKQTEFFVVNLRTRMPFRYGITTLRALPHLFIKATCEIDGKSAVGIAADSLPPKWFTKDADQPFRSELADMLHVIESAAGFAEQVGRQPGVFDLWQAVYSEQMKWAAEEQYPPLLWNFGVSLVERAAIDAHCRARGITFGQAVRENTLGITLGEVHKVIGEYQPAGLLPEQPLRRIHVRQTVGGADPIDEQQIKPGHGINDGLPETLEQAIRAYGLRYFKIKLSSDTLANKQRLASIASLFDEIGLRDYHATLDGNEAFMQLVTFYDMWMDLLKDMNVRPLLKRVLAVEQPLHRDVAISILAESELEEYKQLPPMIIDESDGVIGALPEALECDYDGGAHKNCKGVFKGIANACLIRYRQRLQPDLSYTYTGEDLVNVGPVALPQDLAVAATLGLEHVERNGHHFFRGLSFLPDDLQHAMLQAHGDLYRQHEQGFATLDIQDGMVSTASVVDAPFGYAIDFDPAMFTPLDQWSFDSLDIETGEEEA